MHTVRQKSRFPQKGMIEYMKNPLNRRLPRELKSELGKYLVIFVFLAGMIAIVSGFLVANDSMTAAYDEGFEKYNIEDGNFTLSDKASDTLLDALGGQALTVYENFYTEEQTQEVDSTLRIFKHRTEINRACLMDGAFPQNEHEIAIDRMYADNNKLSVGDTLTVGDVPCTISGLVALSDYSALYQNPSDMMFDAVQFGVAVMTEDGFARYGQTHLHYCYAWQYADAPDDDKDAQKRSEALLPVLAQQAAISGNAVTGFLPQYANQAIRFTGDDIKRDNTIMAVFLYIVILIIAFIFAITTANTITKEAATIGTLRASGYTKGELLRHYLTMPLLVMFAAAVVGNVLGYTCFKGIMASMYYGSYSLPTYVTRWNASAFVRTTLVPLAIMLAINCVVLISRLSLSPLQFLRRELSRRPRKKAIRLSTRIGILKRFRLRVVLQNLPNYITILVGVLFANIILLFGMMFGPLLDRYESDITSNMLCAYQYLLKTPQETVEESAEPFCAASLNTPEGQRVKSEEVMLYGIAENSRYLELDFSSGGVYLSNAYAEKHSLKAGDTITLHDPYSGAEYAFTVAGVYFYPASLAVFMPQDDFNRTFDKEADFFNGYFSETALTDLDELNVAASITRDDLTKTSRQLKVSMGNMMSLFLVFGVLMFMLMIYLLSKLIIEKNAQSISMTKILGYTGGEISSLYILTTTIVVIGALLATMPLVNTAMEYVCIAVFADYAGWLPYYVPLSVFVKMAALGIASYAVIAYIQLKKIKRIPMSDALKNVE